MLLGEWDWRRRWLVEDDACRELFVSTTWGKLSLPQTWLPCIPCRTITRGTLKACSHFSAIVSVTWIYVYSACCHTIWKRDHITVSSDNNYNKWHLYSARICRMFYSSYNNKYLKHHHANVSCDTHCLVITRVCCEWCVFMSVCHVTQISV